MSQSNDITYATYQDIRSGILNTFRFNPTYLTDVYEDYTELPMEWIFKNKDVEECFFKETNMMMEVWIEKRLMGQDNINIQENIYEVMCELVQRYTEDGLLENHIERVWNELNEKVKNELLPQTNKRPLHIRETTYPHYKNRKNKVHTYLGNNKVSYFLGEWIRNCSKYGKMNGTFKLRDEKTYEVVDIEPTSLDFTYKMVREHLDDYEIEELMTHLDNIEDVRLDKGCECFEF